MGNVAELPFGCSFKPRLATTAAAAVVVGTALSIFLTVAVLAI